MITALKVFVVVAVAVVVDAGYVAPVASGYIYRNDNHGPASLIQLGAIPYQQPHAFAPPLPLAQPVQLQALEAYDLASVPAPLPYVAPQPIISEDAEEDDDENSDESSEEEYLDSGDLVEHHGEAGRDHGHAYEKEGGNDYSEEHHEAQGEKGSKGYISKGHHTNGESGLYGKEHNEGHFDENKSNAESYHDETDAHGKKYEAGSNHKGGDHGHKKHFSKGEEVTGYHKVFHKDEFKKDHDFYDVADKSGHFKKYDNEHQKHGSEKGGHKEGGNHDSAYDKGGFNKKGFHAKGHVDESGEGHSAEEGHDSHYSHEKNYDKKGDNDHEKEYAYDDEEDEE